MNVLVLNCGSSSAKFAVINTSGQELISGIAQRLGSAHASLDWKINGQKQTRDLHRADHDLALRAVVELLKENNLADELAGVGHRVVHGGAKFSGSRALTPEVIEKIKECIPLGPLHNPPNLLGIQIAMELFPKLPQVGVFDTAFHQTMPQSAYLYAVPWEWYEQHEIRRYGFHGTSHRFVSESAIKQYGLDPNNSGVITAHLGNGCSCAAVKNGKSVDTTMGLTPLEGVVMGTRSGSIDPAIIAHMAKALNKTADDITDTLNKRSGLLGVSGLSNDMRTLHEAAVAGNERAALAIDMFCYRVAKAIAALAVSTGRVDAIVFTGGIGENATFVRAKVVEGLKFMGMTLDPAANLKHGRETNGRITVETKPQAVVIPTNEELMIALDTSEIISSGHAIA
jgi:acetate kinase